MWWDEWIHLNVWANLRFNTHFMERKKMTSLILVLALDDHWFYNNWMNPTCVHANSLIAVFFNTHEIELEMNATFSARLRHKWLAILNEANFLPTLRVGASLRLFFINLVKQNELNSEDIETFRWSYDWCSGWNYRNTHALTIKWC